MLTFCVVPDIINAIAALGSEMSWADRDFDLIAAFVIVRGAIVTAITLAMMWVSTRSRADFGLVRPRWVDVPISIGANLGSWVLYYVFMYALWAAATAVYFIGFPEIAVLFQQPESGRLTAPVGVAGMVLLVLMSACNGFAEEIVMRGFLIPQFRTLFGGNALAAVTLSAALFAAYHVYQGVYGLAGAFAGGMIFGLVFVKTRRLWPLVIAHATWDIVGILGMSTGQ